MRDLTRRSFNVATLQAALMGCLVQSSVRAEALEGTLKWSVRPWLRRLEDASAALASGSVAPRQWQREVEGILGGVQVSDFLGALDFERLAAAATFPSERQRREVRARTGKSAPRTSRSLRGPLWQLVGSGRAERE